MLTKEKREFSSKDFPHDFAEMIKEMKEIDSYFEADGQMWSDEDHYTYVKQK